VAFAVGVAVAAAVRVTMSGTVACAAVSVIVCHVAMTVANAV